MQYFNPIYSIKEQSQMLFNMKNCTDLHLINIWVLEREFQICKKPIWPFSVTR